jgi:predicted amidohydrolase
MSELSITLIQTDLIWEDKQANLEKLGSTISRIPENTHLIILPEMFSTGFSMRPDILAEKMDGHTFSWMKRQAKQVGSIITGSLIIEEDGRYFNRLIWMLPNGQFGYYDKRHCFSLAGEDKYYTAGSKRFIASVNGWKVNLCICYDLRFPVWNRQFISPDSSGPEYDLLVYVANWPDRRIHAWKTLLAARAIENQCFVAGVNRVGNDGNGIYHSGYSSLFDPLGEILVQKADVEAAVTVKISRDKLEEVRSNIPFWRDADPFLLL